MKDEILLSEKHGVNPSLACCIICGADHSVLLFGRLQNDRQAPHKVSQGICQACEDAIKSGAVLCVEVRDGESGNNPYRTGRIFGVRKDAFTRIFTLPAAVEKGFCFIPESLVKRTGMDKVEPVGLPQEAVNDDPPEQR